MFKLFKLHQYGNDTYYAIICSNPLSEELLQKLKEVFEKLSSLSQQEYDHVWFRVSGFFKEFTDSTCNGLVHETCSHPLNEGANFDEAIRPWQKYDYVNKKYVDWYGPLMTKGDQDEEFKAAYEFSYHASFRSSLLAAGVPEKDIEKSIIFEVTDCRDCYETNPFDFAQWVLKQTKSLEYINALLLPPASQSTEPTNP